ncbi:MAG TPA: NAD(P)/FAD-dependent oxidoreductase [Rhodanobacteraceae bacterium]|nr:NAD(P)/FAD-dependent oxidoreductase [Rhodanobacteraceae bacterium]
MQDGDTFIVGAGPAGLAVAAALQKKGVPFEILERNESVGSSWRHHYDRLHLHTPKQHSALPFVPFPKTYPRYPSRDQVVEYLENYAHTFDLRPQFGVDVLRCSRTADDRWEVRTNRDTHRARNLVIASGFSRVPRRPSWPGLDDFEGTGMHSSEYANGRRFQSQRALVIGFGNSGAEIALDLSECGADCAISIRGPVNVVPREILHVPITYFALASRGLPPRVADRLNALTTRLAIGDLTRLGIRKPNDGPTEGILVSRRIPVVDVGTVGAMCAGKIAVRPDVESFSRNAVHFVDGGFEPFDAIVLATGYDTGLHAMFDGGASVLDDSGHPRADASEAAPGLYFCGFDIVPAGLIRQIGIEALRIADRIASG